MMLRKVDEFEVDGRRFALYKGGSFVLFEEDGDDAEGIGAIERSDHGFISTPWWYPALTLAAPSLPAAIWELIALDPPGRD